MSAPALLTLGSLAEIAGGLVALVALIFLSAPYGRHSRAGWGPTLGARLGWHLMEAPALFGFVAVALSHRLGPVGWILFGLWVLHYGYRDLIYPRRLPDPFRPMALVVVALGFCFNLLNGPLNGLQVGAGRYELAWLADPRFLAGVALFLVGLVLNRMADQTLRALRDEKPDGYSIPRGGLHELVSCPNYLAEIVQWMGWALATGSLAGAAFAIFTAGNLAPRALQHHRWYREQFADYPRSRKALIPFVL